jgi:hypothetical protein
LGRIRQKKYIGSRSAVCAQNYAELRTFLKSNITPFPVETPTVTGKKDIPFPATDNFFREVVFCVTIFDYNSVRVNSVHKKFSESASCGFCDVCAMCKSSNDLYRFMDDIITLKWVQSPQK